MDAASATFATGELTAWINLAAIRHNLRLVRHAVGPDVRICPAVKANAYGHGIGVVLPALRQAKVDMLAVATLAEAIELRELCWTGGILVFGRPVPGSCTADACEAAIEAVRHGVTCTVADRSDAEALSHAAVRLGRRVAVHVKLDSGMSRAGLLPADAAALIGRVRSLPGLCVEAVYTHFATSDEADLSYAWRQLAAFREAVACIDVPIRHAANTAAIFRLPESHFDMVRPGVGVYGYWPDPSVPPPVPLRPALKLVSRLVTLKRVPKGQAVGYGCTFLTQRPSILGLVPIGYEDGYFRSLSNRAVMTLRAGSVRPATVPVVGRVSMDQTIVDVTDVPEVREGDPVVIIDDDPGAPNSVAALARLMNTIPYEVTCNLGRRVSRLTVDTDT